MNFDEFTSTLKYQEPPQQLNPLIEALWWDAKGFWEKAHMIAQDEHSADGAWVHAYLHRKEGEDWNAAYWYRQAKKPVCHENLEQEWREIVKALLN